MSILSQLQPLGREVDSLADERARIAGRIRLNCDGRIYGCEHRCQECKCEDNFTHVNLISLSEYRYYQATLSVYERYGRDEKVFFRTLSDFFRRVMVLRVIRRKLSDGFPTASNRKTVLKLERNPG